MNSSSVDDIRDIIGDDFPVVESPSPRCGWEYEGKGRDRDRDRDGDQEDDVSLSQMGLHILCGETTIPHTPEHSLIFQHVNLAYKVTHGTLASIVDTYMNWSFDPMGPHLEQLIGLYMRYAPDKVVYVSGPSTEEVTQLNESDL